MTCNLCNHDCNQGRDCPYRVQRRASPLLWIGCVLIFVAVLAVAMWAEGRG